MAWMKVDDRLHSSRKLRSIPRAHRMAAMGLWIIAGSWTASEGLDGFVPDFMVEELGGSEDIAERLVACALWDAVDGGYQFHNWTVYNPDAASARAKHASQSEGGALGNHRRWHTKNRTPTPGCQWCESVTDRSTDSVTDGESESAPNPPDPTRPDPTLDEIPSESLSSEVAVADHRPEIDYLLDLLDAEIVRNGGKKPSRTKKNRDAVRLMLDRDGHSEAQIEAAIRWCQGDEFWRANILSASKLREKYDQLRLVATRAQSPRGPSRLTPEQRARQTYAELSGIERLEIDPTQEQMT